MVDKVGLGAAVALMLLPSAASACNVAPFTIAWGADADSHMAVRSTEACKFGLHITSFGQVDSVAVAQPPRHGTLSRIDRTNWLYHPARGYAGQDRIVVTFSGSRMDARRVTSGTTNISWAIDVRP